MKIKEFMERKGLTASDVIKAIFSLGLLFSFTIILLCGMIASWM